MASCQQSNLIIYFGREQWLVAKHSDLDDFWHWPIAWLVPLLGHCQNKHRASIGPESMGNIAKKVLTSTDQLTTLVKQCMVSVACLCTRLVLHVIVHIRPPNCYTLWPVLWLVTPYMGGIPYPLGIPNLGDNWICLQFTLSYKAFARLLSLPLPPDKLLDLEQLTFTIFASQILCVGNVVIGGYLRAISVRNFDDKQHQCEPLFGIGWLVQIEVDAHTFKYNPYRFHIMLCLLRLARHCNYLISISFTSQVNLCL